MGFEIRPAEWRDFGALLTLQKQVARETEQLATTGTEHKESIIIAFVKAILHRKRVTTLVAEDKGTLVGYITIVTGKFKKVGETAYVVVGVRASHRGQGIGTALMNKAEEFVRGRRMHRIELEVFQTNEGAMRLYEKLGYQVEGRRREAVKTPNGYTDIVWMGKLL
jgi:ribosomal protein S18 acetylase RimI-like enzyme